jgi:hypothetical protein
MYNTQKPVPSWPLERVCRWLIVALLCLIVPAWMARRVFGVAELTMLTPILCLASLAVLLLSYYAIRHPREIQPTGYPMLDAQILRRRALQRK